MSCRRLYATSLQAILILAASHAYAGGPISPDSDIVGIKLSMTRDQAKQLIQQQFGTTDFPAKTMKFGMPEYNRDIVLGFTGEITSATDKQANQTRMDAQRKAAVAMGCNSPLCMPVADGLIKDTISVYVDPTAGSSGILALVRKTEYPQNSDMLESVFLQSLADKFGKPFFNDNYHGYYWADGIPYSDRINYLNNADFVECSRFADNVADLPAQFTSIMNAFASNSMNGYGKLRTKLPKCSMYLKVSLSSGPKPGGDYNTRYVRGFTMALVNVRSAYGALSAYANDFWSAATKTQQDKSSTQSQNKPKL